MPINNCASSVVRLELAAQQTEQLAPLVQQAAAENKNVLFLALGAPFWRDDALIWELQVMVIPARVGQKIVKMVANSQNWKGGMNAPRPD